MPCPYQETYIKSTNKKRTYGSVPYFPTLTILHFQILYFFLLLHSYFVSSLSPRSSPVQSSPSAPYISLFFFISLRLSIYLPPRTLCLYTVSIFLPSCSFTFSICFISLMFYNFFLRTPNFLKIYLYLPLWYASLMHISELKSGTKYMHPYWAYLIYYRFYGFPQRWVYFFNF